MDLIVCLKSNIYSKIRKLMKGTKNFNVHV